MINVEENLREICRRKGLRLADIAERVGAGQSNLISSVKGNPKLSTLQDIANALNISVSELLTLRPETAQGLVYIDGVAYQLTKPSASTLQLPFYSRYDALRDEIKEFVMRAVASAQTTCKMGLLGTFEAFSLVYDHDAARFTLSLCYSDGKTLIYTYDKHEYCNWENDDTPDTVKWNIPEITEDIINDIEGAVPMKLQSL